MVSIIVNGIRLEVPENKNVLDCALEAGIYIPHLCHHPNLKELGSCRMCIVEVEGETEAVTSCTLKAKEGLKINTNSDRLRKLRNLALELLLAGHPEECTTCPKYGCCELQSLIQYIGANNARMRHRSKGIKVEEGNPLMVHDMNRCVLCGRCVRACNELRGVKVLEYQKKDLEYYIGAVQNKLLKDTDCRFCTACTEVCPTGAIRDKISLIASNQKREDAYVPCRYACPAHTDIPKYVRYVKEGKYDEAAAVIREKLPFPKALGYICSHACELQCKRNALNEPLSIRNIKRHAAEQDTGFYWRGKGKQLPDTGKKVCVVGGGPAGMTAAYYLRKQGHSVTIKEALPELGGMMRYGIPSYRLPRTIVEEEAKVIKDTGILVETNTRVEQPAELLAIYDTVLMTIGTHQGVRLPIEGNQLSGVLLNVDFLRNASMGKPTGIGKKVIVLGGGNVAFDCARTAKRLGADEIHLACLETLNKMPADEEEMIQAREEGIEIYPARTFERITGIKNATGVDFCEVESFTFDENRRAVIIKKENSKHHIEADTVIFAVGQRPDINEAMGMPLGRGNVISTKDGSCATDIKGIFAAGDVTYGTQSVIKAIAAGRDAASEIDRYLGGDGDISEKLAPEQIPDAYIGQVESFAFLPRVPEEIISAEKRKDTFDLVNHGICANRIREESNRCLQCDLRLQITKPKLWSDYTDQKEAN
jgi:NADPH-dependent glutamate synthase beta chain and related oxidoreductases